MSSRSIRRKYGQNYLVDKAILFEMANHVSAKENDFKISYEKATKHLNSGNVLQHLKKIQSN